MDTKERADLMGKYCDRLCTGWRSNCTDEDRAFCFLSHRDSILSIQEKEIRRGK